MRWPSGRDCQVLLRRAARNSWRTARLQRNAGLQPASVQAGGLRYEVNVKVNRELVIMSSVGLRRRPTPLQAAIHPRATLSYAR